MPAPSDASTSSLPDQVVALDVQQPIWNRFFTVAPLVLVGTRETDGRLDFAPKHLVTPMGWQNYFGFVCTPRHSTYQNIARDGTFTVTYPRPSQVVLTSLTAEPRCDDDVKPSLRALPTFPAQTVDGAFVQDGYLFLECEHDRTIDGFDVNSLIVGRIVAAYVDAEALRLTEREDADVVRSVPLLAYLAPGRYATIEQSLPFPFPAGFSR